MQLNETAQISNPTQSQHMAHLIHHMKLFQTQRCGVAPQARSHLTNSEFEHVLEAYWWIPNRELGLVGAAASTFQLAMIGRQDDISKC